MYSNVIGVIHSNKSQANRFMAVDNFQDGTFRLLIATDVIARGLDFKDVTHVINFDLSKEPGTYIHRIGRTGRADKAGTAISFVSEKEMPFKAAIEHLMSKKITLLNLPKDVEISDELTDDEIPVKRDKNLQKTKKILTSGGAFHEKKDKNKKVQLGGKRHQESKRRKEEQYRSKRKF